MLKFDRQGLVPAIIQHHQTGRVLMLGFMNAEALRRTRDSGQVWFYSRSRQRLWQKGETSGNVLTVKPIDVDCDRDTLLIQVEPAGPVCHTGAPAYFFNAVEEDDATAPALPASSAILGDLFIVIEDRRWTLPAGSYTTYLFTEGIDKIGKKIGEEAAEVIIAAKNGEPSRIAEEVADLWYHTLVTLAATGLTPEDVYQELERRRE